MNLGNRHVHPFPLYAKHQAAYFKYFPYNWSNAFLPPVSMTSP